MFSGVPQKNRQAAETYFDEHLSHNDYYTQGQTQYGEWIGMGAQQLGLKPGGVVNRDAFLRLCDNQNPLTGEQLTPQCFRQRRIYFDFVCSPPKSVSILAVTMNDQRIIAAHKEASMVALRELESFAATRIRKDGVENRDRVTGNLVGAAFLHTTSRALDPQLHTHFVLLNCTWDSKEKRWKALQTGGMFGAINYGTQVYRNELVKRLNGMGYSIRRIGSAFEIEGVDPKLIERFSKRSQQRDMAVKRREQELGRKLSKQEVAHVVRQTRAKKAKGVSDEQVRKQQLGEIGFFEKLALRKVVAAANGEPARPAETVTDDGALSHGLAHVFERQSVVPRHKILEAALIKGCGQVDLERLKSGLAVDNKLVRVGSEFSTREILSKELFLIHAVNAGIDAAEPFISRFEPSSRLGPDQNKALAHILTNSDQFTGFRGLAGSGKSTMLRELANTLRKENRSCLFCAPTASAADTLRREGLDTMTLQGLLGSLPVRVGLTSRSVIVLDEAGAVGLDDMVKLFEVARRSGCRVVFSGDTGQHASVARGDALRILEQYSGYRFSELTTIRRQKPEAFRQVVELAAAKQTEKAFARLVELGAVTEVPLDDNGGHAQALYQRAADAYVSARKQGKSALLVSPTWAEIEAVTEMVRETLKADGVLGEHEETVPAFDSLSWTEAQKKDARQYEPGQRLRFVRHNKKFERGETVEVIAQPAAGHNTLRVRRADGSETFLTLGAGSACFDVGEARELKIAAGDWLLLQANHGREFVNGESVQVKAVQDRRITLADGRVLPANFNAFTYGYAVTSHSSQGKTVDEVLLVASSKSFAAVNREQFYVSISRGRESVQVFTDDSELLAQRVTDSHDRKAAVELTELRQELAKLGFTGKRQATTVPPDLRPQPDFRTVRPMRSAIDMRPMRLTRLPLVQRLAQMVQDVRRWMGEHDHIEEIKPVAISETVKPAEDLKQAAKISAAIPEPSRVRPAIKINALPPRRSRGIGI